MKILTKNIRYIRKQRGVSQELFADDLSVTRGRICAYECNKAIPTLEFIIKLSEYSKLSIDTLVKENLDKLEQ
ncbi:helix-turn-helix domain-containing protein [Lutibacter citreus]|uniref:helix-turn-helix domain-containing protein n=1 Tax=Lutibacter citreus TaxID=2138210 RepID=UPI000DBE0D3B|nr:helix-turn-helix transcriptional regulator [Lutibacter citreus]